MRIDKDVPMTARDGVVLRADVYRPDAPGRFPVLLSRLPYDKNWPPAPRRHRRLRRARLRRDHAGHARPLRLDGGEYEPLVWEAQDGYDAVEWAAQLPYADGNVGTMGQSYLGATQYLLAPTRPPHLRAAFPASAPADFHQCWVYHTGGAFELGWQIPYAILMARDTIERHGLTATLLPELERVLAPAPTPWAPPLDARGLPAAAPHGLGRAARAGGAVSRRLPAASRRRRRRGGRINVGAAARGDRRAHVPRDAPGTTSSCTAVIANFRGLRPQRHDRGGPRARRSS